MICTGLARAEPVRLKVDLQVGDRYNWRISSTQTSAPIYSAGSRSAVPVEMRVQAEVDLLVTLVDMEGNHTCSLQTAFRDVKAFIGGTPARRAELPPMPPLLVTLDPGGEVLRMQTMDSRQGAPATQNPYVNLIFPSMPDDPVDVGSTWNVSRAATSRGDKENSTKFESIETINGDRCAKIVSRFGAPIAGNLLRVPGAPQGADVTAEVFGEATTWFSLQRGVVVKVESSAEYETTVSASLRKQKYLTRIRTLLVSGDSPS